MSARLVLLLIGAASAVAVADPIADISRCAAVTGRDARLACYDELGSRYGVKKAAPGAATAPVTAATPVTSPAAVKSAPAPSPAPPVANAAARAPAESRADFGLTASQKAKDPEAPKMLTAIEGVVSGFGRTPGGHQVVRVDNSQSWELLEDSDPLLTPGDKVSIRRAVLGSFIMTTPSGREHRVKRLSQ